MTEKGSFQLNIEINVTVSEKMFFLHEEYGKAGPYDVVLAYPSKSPVIEAPDGKQYQISLPEIIERVAGLIEQGAFNEAEILQS